jgi:hypothetical protein
VLHLRARAMEMFAAGALAGTIASATSEGGHHEHPERTGCGSLPGDQ